MERLVITENGEERVYNIASRVITLGRSSKNDVPIKDRNASRRHCNILKIADSWFVVDCDSQNGTFVNGEKIKKRELEDGDKISISSTEILFLIAQNKDEIPEAQELPKKIPSPTSSGTEDTEDQPDVGGEEDDKNETSESGLLAVSMAKNEKKPEQRPHPSEEVVFEPQKMPVAVVPENAVNPTNKEPSKATAKQSIITNAQNIRWVKKCYEQLQKQIIPELTDQEQIAKLFFISLIAGGHCWLQGSSLIHQHILIHKIVKCFGLSCQILFLKNSEQLQHIAPECDVLAVAYAENHYAELASFIMEQNMMQLHSSINKSVKAPMVIVCDNSANLAKIPLSLRNALMFVLDLPQATLPQGAALLGYWHKQADKQPQVITGKEDIYSFRRMIDTVHISYGLQEYIAKLVYSTQPEYAQTPSSIRDTLQSGADMFSTILIQKAAQAWAAFHSHDEVLKSDIQTVAGFILPNKFVLPNASPDRPQSLAILPTQIFQNLLLELEPKDNHAQE